jgi:riboflavin-specific deaminase-like protein
MNVVRRERPLVIVNFAITADGKISTRRRTPSLFSSPRDKHTLLAIRAGADAVLVGRATVSSDAMTMGLPDAKLRSQRVARGQAEFPLRVIVTNSGRLDAGLRLFQAKAGSILIFTSSLMSRRNEAALRARGATVHRHAGRAVRLAAMLKQLRADYGARVVVCEGGATLFRSLVEHDLVDRLHLTICPAIFGGRGAPTLTGLPGVFLPHGVRLRTIAQQITPEGEFFLEFAVQRPAQKAKGASC